MRIFWLVAFLAAFKSTVLISVEAKSTYSLVQIIPKNEDELQLLSILYITNVKMVNFWKPPGGINDTVDIMISPNFKNEITQIFEKNSIHYRTIIDDVAQYLIDRNETRKRSIMLDQKLWLRDDSFSNVNFPLGEYHSYDDIVQWLKSLEGRFPDIVNVTFIGHTFEKRAIYGVKLGTKHTHSAPVIWIDGGIHAREWASVHTALYLIKQLITEYYTNPKIKNYLKLLDIHIYPCLNPDGYEYTRSDPTNPSVRMWRKNRSCWSCMWIGNNDKDCLGVDLNRNFDFHFAEVGSSFSPCSELYHGASAFSEPETRAVRDAILSLSDKMEVYITLHTYAQLWLFPYSNERNSFPHDVEDLEAIAKKAVESSEKLYGTKYRYGTSPELLYKYAGGASDWVKETARVKYSYTIELRPSHSAQGGFILDRTQLIPTGKETYEGIKVVIDKVIEESEQLREVNSSCKDENFYCANWKQQNPRICTDSKSAMKKLCKGTCEFC